MIPRDLPNNRRIGGNIRGVSRERFGVIDRGQRTTKRVVFNQPGGDKLVRGSQNISERDA